MKYTDKQLQDARNAVADFWIENARAIRKADPYASHVTERQKKELLQEALSFAESIRSGHQDGCMTIAQRIHLHITGECPAILP